MKKSILYTIEDTFIGNKVAHKNFSDLPYIILEYYGQGEEKSIFVGLLKFSLDDLYNVDEINYANLCLYIEKGGAEYNDKSYIEIFINKNQYKTNVVSWDYSTDIEKTGITKNKLIENEYFKIDIKDIVKRWIYNEEDNNGISLFLRKGNERVYISSTRGENPPYLEIEYSNFIENKCSCKFGDSKAVLKKNIETKKIGHGKIDNFKKSEKHISDTDYIVEDKNMEYDLDGYESINYYSEIINESKVDKCKKVVERNNYSDIKDCKNNMDFNKFVPEIVVSSSMQFKGVVNELIPNGSIMKWVGDEGEVSTDIFLLGGKSYFIGLKISTIVSCDNCFNGAVIYLDGRELEDTTIISASVSKGNCISIYGSTILKLEYNSVLQVEYITNNELPSNKEYCSSLTIYNIM